MKPSGGVGAEDWYPGLGPADDITKSLTSLTSLIYSTLRYLWFRSCVASSVSVLTGAPERDYGACRRFLGGQSYRGDSTGRFGANKDGVAGGKNEDGVVGGFSCHALV